MKYKLVVTYADGTTHEHESRNQYELDMSSERFQNYFSIEFFVHGEMVAGLYNWDKQPKYEDEYAE